MALTEKKLIRIKWKFTYKYNMNRDERFELWYWNYRYPREGETIQAMKRLSVALDLENWLHDSEH